MFEITDARIVVRKVKFDPRMSRRQTPEAKANLYFQHITEQRRWKAIAASSNHQPIKTRFRKYFHTYWTTAGRTIREQIANDLLLARLLRASLPTYQGSHLTLYRGENRDRWQARKVGLCWSSQIDTARMFGQGLNAVGSGGVLLVVEADANSIISAPGEHSLYLRESEFTVDPSLLGEISEAETYPPSA